MSSFGITASGTKPAVVQQLEDQKDDDEDSLKNEVLQSLIDHVVDQVPDDVTAVTVSGSVSVFFNKP